MTFRDREPAGMVRREAHPLVGATDGADVGVVCRAAGGNRACRTVLVLMWRPGWRGGAGGDGGRGAVVCTVAAGRGRVGTRGV